MGTRRCAGRRCVTGSNPPAARGYLWGSAGGRSWVPYPPIVARPGREPAALPPDRGGAPPLDPGRPDRPRCAAAGDPGLRPPPRGRRGDGHDRLRAADRRGLPRGAPGRGTLVAPGAARPARRDAAALACRAARRARLRRRGRVRPAHAVRRARVARSSRAPTRDPRYDFRTGSTSLDLFPSAVWERLLPTRRGGTSSPTRSPRPRTAGRRATRGCAPSWRRTSGCPGRSGRRRSRSSSRPGRRARSRPRPAVAVRRADASRWRTRRAAPPARRSTASGSRRSRSRSTIAGCSWTGCRRAPRACS